MVKLYIFDSVEEAKAFNESAPQKAFLTEGDLPKSTSRPAKPVKHSDPDREAQKQRILEKAKTMSAGAGRGNYPRKCKVCGDLDHKTADCPDKVPEDEISL